MKEEIASIQHDIWSGWMKYLFSKATLLENGSVNIRPEHVKRWERQMITPYSELPEKEKNSDRNQADKVLKIILDIPKQPYSGR